MKNEKIKLVCSWVEEVAELWGAGKNWISKFWGAFWSSWSSLNRCLGLKACPLAESNPYKST